jgi:hypothetical protein
VFCECPVRLHWQVTALTIGLTLDQPKSNRSGGQIWLLPVQPFSCTSWSSLGWSSTLHASETPSYTTAQMALMQFSLRILAHRTISLWPLRGTPWLRCRLFLRTVSWYGRLLLSSDLILMSISQIWRVYAIWGSNWKVALFPALLTCLAFGIEDSCSSLDPILKLLPAFGILYVDVAHLPPQQINQTWASNIGTIYYSSTLTNTVISSILIISRVLFMAGKSGISRYRRVLEAVVESAALYSIMLIIYVPFVSNPAPWTGPPTLMLQSVVIPITVCFLNRPRQGLQLTLRWILGHRTHADHPTNPT